MRLRPALQAGVHSAAHFMFISAGPRVKFTMNAAALHIPPSSCKCRKREEGSVCSLGENGVCVSGVCSCISRQERKRGFDIQMSSSLICFLE